MKYKMLIILILGAIFSPLSASGVADSLSFDLRLGYTIGGTMPLGMPASIRSINAYTPQLNPQLMVTTDYAFNNRWGIISGVKVERKAMKTDAKVKGYHMVMTQGDESIEGFFTGNVLTKASTWGVTLPVQVSYSVSNAVKLRVGPYISWLIGHSFKGYAYDGYLRKDAPTGERVEIGNTIDTRGEYDFSDDMRRMQVGLDFGVDYNISKNYGIYADLQWGLNGAFKSTFKTIEQTVYPIYGTIGIIKHL